jgi:hypothetical protein
MSEEHAAMQSADLQLLSAKSAPRLAIGQRQGRNKLLKLGIRHLGHARDAQLLGLDNITAQKAGGRGDKLQL